ncbi:MAG: hypothetical protein K2Z81_25540 [Cyanobacteria bacterium]|nr:hypothetical protein [Cyanobacteriota bacterium]
MDSSDLTTTLELAKAKNSMQNRKGKELQRSAIEVDTLSNLPTQRGRRLTIGKADLDWASEQGLIAPDKVNTLWNALLTRDEEAPKFDMANLLWYAGAAVVLLAMSWFLFLVAVDYNATVLLVTSGLYAAAFVGSGRYMWASKNLRVPAGLMYTLAVSMVPVIGMATMSLFGVTRLDTSHQIILELSTLLASVVALKAVRFPFLTLPLYASLWAMSFTLIHGLGVVANITYRHDLLLTMAFGSVISLIAYITDRQTKTAGEDYSFWGYFFGGSAAWTAWTIFAFDQGGHPLLFSYFLTNVAFLFLSVVLQRQIFVLGGAIGITAYLSYLAFDIFKGSMAFPLVLTLIGAGVIFCGVQYRKHIGKIEQLLADSFGTKKK